MNSKSIDRFHVENRLKLVDSLLEDRGANRQAFSPINTEKDVVGNIENWIGDVHVPLGIAGPVNVRGVKAVGEFFVPMATSEGTLVASYSRGMKLMNACGGCETAVLRDHFLRGPMFIASSLKAALRLRDWCEENEDKIRAAVNESDPFISLIDSKCELSGNTLLVSMSLSTGDAMGSNMGSKASLAAAEVIKESGLTEKIIVPYPEDKKYIPGRQKGKHVIASVVLDRDTLYKYTRANLDDLADFVVAYRSLLAMHGGHSLNVHAANGLAAFYLATGQDIAYLGESSQAVVDAKKLDQDHLEFTVTLPALIIGTVGGGTGLPSARAALDLCDCYGASKAQKLAELMAATVLAGEISCSAAQCAMEFVKAHEAMGKNDPTKK